MRVLGVNAVFHDPSAALVVDGRTVAAAEEERFSRRKHGKEPVPFSTWELPVEAMRWCLSEGGMSPSELDAVAYSYDPALAVDRGPGLDPAWEGLRRTYVERAPHFLATALPGLDPSQVVFSPHHVAHAASAARPPRPPRAAARSSPPTAAVRTPRTWPGPTPRTAGWRSWPTRNSPSPSAWSTKNSPSTSGSAGPATSTRSWRSPPTGSRPWPV